MAASVTDLTLLGAACAAVGAACLVPNRLLPPLPNDKLLHFGAFAVLAALALRAEPAWPPRALWLAGLMGLGVLIECLQTLVPDRGFCWRDVAANGSGIAFSALGAHLISLFA